MKELVESWIDKLIKDPESRKDLETRSHLRTLILGSSIGVITGLLSVAIVWNLIGPKWYFIFNAVCIALIGLSPLYFWLTQSYIKSANIVMGLALACVFTLTPLVVEIQNSAIVAWYSLVPLAAGVVFGHRGVYPWVGYTVFTVFASSIWQYFLLPEGASNYGPVLYFVNATMSLICFGVITIAFTKTIDDHAKRIEKSQENYRTLLRVLSHDISNPLAVIRVRSQFMTSRKNLDPKQLKDWQRIDFASSAITDILEDVRKLEKLSTGVENIRISSVCINETLHHVTEMFEEKLSEKKLVVHIDCPDEPIHVEADANSLKYQVISNLISNAIKFSRPDSQIEISVQKDDEYLILKVSDSGIGIPKSMISDLFEPSMNTSRKGTQGEKGTGFGMLILKKYIESYGGQIFVQSRSEEDGETDSGTTVEIHLKISENGVLAA